MAAASALNRRRFPPRVEEQQAFAATFSSTYNMTLETTGRRFLKAYVPETAEARPAAKTIH